MLGLCWMIIEWTLCTVDGGDGCRGDEGVNECSQWAYTATVHQCRHPAAVWVTRQLSWRWDGNVGRHGHGVTWSCWRAVYRVETDRWCQYNWCLSHRQQVSWLLHSSLISSSSLILCLWWCQIDQQRLFVC